MPQFNDLVTHVFVERMSGPKLDDAHEQALQSWVNAIPALPPFAQQTDSSIRGQALFEQRCTACHSGDKHTNNQTVDIGKGRPFQVPPLVGVAWRPPFLHDGCGTTLFDRFDPTCGGSGHGVTSDLSKDQVGDLVAFLQTL
jgi:mono/diheme cytochrome c family protein